MRTRTIAGIPKRTRFNNPNKDVSRENPEGAPMAWTKEHHICIRWQQGQCKIEEDHFINGGSVTLKHICMVCAYLKKPEDRTHFGSNCSGKNLVFGN
jgi:hypothetical protein